MNTRHEKVQRVVEHLNNIESEMACREGVLFDGELQDALLYLEEVRELLEDLNSDIYELEENEEEY